MDRNGLSLCEVASGGLSGGPMGFRRCAQWPLEGLGEWRLCVGTAFAALVVAACSSGRSLPPADVDTVADLPLVGDIGFESAEPDTRSGEFCSVLWQVRTFRSGGTAHLAMGKQGIVYVAAYQKLYALDSEETGRQEWVWPDGDSQSGIEVLEEQLFTPVVGLEGAIALGSSKERLLVINRTGVARFVVPTEGPITGAPALSADKRIVALTESGALYLVRDLGQNKPHVVWSKTGEAALKEVVANQQPLVGIPSEAGHETVWVLQKSGAVRIDLETGEVLGETPLAEGHVPTSNAILDEEGAYWFLTGKGTPNGGIYFDETWLWAVSAAGVVREGLPLKVSTDSTRAVSLSQGVKRTLLIGTSTHGVSTFSLTTMQPLSSDFINYSDVAQPVQGRDGIIYFGAWPHWIEVYSETLEPLWEKRLFDPNDPMGAQMAASSPLILANGDVLFHNGNAVTALRCTSAGPAIVTWPRFGGNERNTGNLADSATIEE